MKIANIYLEITNHSFNKKYSYKIEDNQDIKVTDAVLVDFNNQLKIGFVVEVLIDDSSNLGYDLKSVIGKVDVITLNEYQRSLLKYLNKKLYGNFLNMYKLFLPKNNNIQADVHYYKDGNLVGKHSEFKGKENKAFLDDSQIEKKVDIIIKKKQMQTLYLCLSDKQINSDLKLTQRQKSLYELMQKENKIVLNKVKTDYKYSDSIINKLIDMGLIEKISLQSKFNEKYMLEINGDVKLTHNQQEVVDKIYKSKKPILLHGVTSSGKTEVYIAYMKRLLKEDPTAQLLLISPQMSLALQLTSRMQAEFDDVIIYHDKLTDLQKITYFKQIKDAKVVVGTKESIFLPFTNLKTVIIDEEHDDLYKSKGVIKYHLYDMIDFLKSREIKTILASATPSIESYSKAKKELYELVKLDKRYNNYKLPDVKFIANQKNEIISKQLMDLVKINKSRKTTTLIYFHKVGYSKKIECNNCFHIECCDLCGNTLTYFKEKNQLKCNFCGVQKRYTHKCSNCQSDDINYGNIGIEKFKDELQKNFTDLQIKLLTNEMNKNQILDTLMEVKNKEVDIVIGTQIMSRGLNFIDISNIYIVNIDEMLFLNEYNSNERTYNLLTQIIGRAGRNLKYSEVFIESHHQDHFVMRSIQSENYDDYYNEEMATRKMLKNPPYFNICKIEVRHKNKKLLENKLNEQIKFFNENKFMVSKANTPFIDKIGDEYRMYILIKYRTENIKKLIKIVHKDLQYNNIKVFVDMKMTTNGK